MVSPEFFLNFRFSGIQNTDKVCFYHLDHLGTPQAITDREGNIVWQADYKPFGEAAATTGDVRNNFRFPGQYYDAETGLHYNWHRYYDPDTGRYLTPDIIGLEGGVNLYAYVRGNPINLIDPDGLKIRIKGSDTDRALLVGYLSNIVGISLESDNKGYVSDNFSSPEKFSEVGGWLKEIIRSPYTVIIRFGACQTGGSGCFNPFEESAVINPGLKDRNQRDFYYHGPGEKWYDILGSTYYYQPEGVLAHELLGHGLDYVRTMPEGYITNDQATAIKRTNKIRKLLGIKGRRPCDD